tara:strand:- start:145 stop:321 length:177 start_codon:yes stop_codon:yes gene_type:complete
VGWHTLVLLLARVSRERLSLPVAWVGLVALVVVAALRFFATLLESLLESAAAVCDVPW